MLCALKEANDRGVDFHDAGHEKEIKTGVQVNPFEEPDRFGKSFWQFWSKARVHHL